MPPRLPITNKGRARRHVLGQELYRLRKQHSYLKGLGLTLNAARVMEKMVELSREYEEVGGKPGRVGPL